MKLLFPSDVYKVRRRSVLSKEEKKVMIVRRRSQLVLGKEGLIYQEEG